MRTIFGRMNRRSFVGSCVAATGPLWLPNLTLSAEGPANANAAASKVEDLNSVLQPLLEKDGLPALAAGALQKGKLVALGAVGTRKAGSGVSVTTSDKFHLGSDTKAMTATGMAMLVEQRKLQWDRTLSQVFPERTTKMDPAFRKVTLEMLLTHQAGLAHDGTDYGPPKAPVTEQRLAYMDAILAKPPKTEPGTRYSYSNAGYIIAGTILERVTGVSWEMFMQEKLFKPLGMTSAGFGPAGHRGQTDQPWGHVLKEGVFEPRFGDNPPALGPAGTVHCSVADYLKFADLHATQGLRPPGLLQPAFFAKLHQPAKSNYAMGWVTGERGWAKGPVLQHTGSNTMNFFTAWIAPKIDLCMVVACNAAGEKVPGIMDKVVEHMVHEFAG